MRIKVNTIRKKSGAKYEIYIYTVLYKLKIALTQMIRYEAKRRLTLSSVSMCRQIPSAIC